MLHKYVKGNVPLSAAVKQKGKKAVAFVVGTTLV